MGNDTWMGDLGPTLVPKQMRDVVLPGTHDSGTYSLNPSIAGSKIAPGGPNALYLIDSAVNAGTSSLMTMVTGLFPVFGPLVYGWIIGCITAWFATERLPSTVQAWSMAQTRTITQQLTDGIRYFDLRIAPLNGVPTIVHGHYGDSAEDLLKDVYSFLTAPGRSSEIVILDFNHFYEMTPDLHQQLVGTIMSIFGSLVAPRDVYSPTTTVGVMWSQRKQVIVLYGGDQPGYKPYYGPSTGADAIVEANDYLWPGNPSDEDSPDPWIISPYPDSSEVGDIMTYLNDELDIFRPVNSPEPPDPSTFYVVQGIVTPSVKDVACSALWMQPDNLIDAGAPVTEAVDMALMTQWASRDLNIVFCDAYQNSIIPSFAVAANGGASDSLVALWGAAGSGGARLKVGTCPASKLSAPTFSVSSPQAGSGTGAAKYGVGAATFKGALVAAWQPYYLWSSAGIQVVSTYTPFAFPSAAVTLFDPVMRKQQHATDAPALIEFNDRLYISWVYSDKKMYMMSSIDGVVFDDKVTISVPTAGKSTPQPAQSTHRPALAVFDGRLWLAWTNASDGQVLLTSTADGTMWAVPVAVGGTSSRGPALTVFLAPEPGQEVLVLGWSDTVVKDQVNVAVTTDGQSFAPRKLTYQGQPDCASGSPALTSLGEQLYLSFPEPSGDYLVLRWSPDGQTWLDEDRYVQPPPTTMTATGNGALVSFVSAPVTIDALSPSEGQPGTAVAIEGTGLAGTVVEVIFGTTKAIAPQTNSNSNVLSVTVPEGATSGPVSVTIFGSGTAQSVEPFIVNGQPVIDEIQPPGAPAGTAIEIVGYGLDSVQEVEFAAGSGSWTASASHAADNSVSCVVPNATPGPMTVTVKCRTGATATNPQPFIVASPLTIKSFAPTSGVVGDPVTIAVQGQPESITSVVFGGDVQGEVVSVTSDTVQAVVPEGAVTGPIAVNYPGGTIISNQSFTVQTSALPKATVQSATLSP